MNEKETRPWGTFEVIGDSDVYRLSQFEYKLKKLTIFAGECISLQYHNYRGEIWHIISGKGTVVNYANGSDREEFKYISGDTFEIPQGNIHKILADTETVVFEVQLGSYFGEDDIIRLEDKYGRIKEGMDK